MVIETDVVIVVFLQNLSAVKLVRHCHVLKCWMTNVHCGGCVVARPETGLELDTSRLDGDLAAYSVNQTRLQRTLLGRYFLRPSPASGIVVFLPWPASGIQYFDLSVVCVLHKNALNISSLLLCYVVLLGPFYGAIAVPSVTCCRCCC